MYSKTEYVFYCFHFLSYRHLLQLKINMHVLSPVQTEIQMHSVLHRWTTTTAPTQTICRAARAVTAALQLSLTTTTQTQFGESLRVWEHGLFFNQKEFTILWFRFLGALLLLPCSWRNSSSAFHKEAMTYPLSRYCPTVRGPSEFVNTPSPSQTPQAW